VGGIAKYFAKNDFWAFCITSFVVFGLFLGNLPVAMAYVGDVFTSKKEKQDTLGRLVSCYVMGNSGGESELFSS
jgi:MFS family permease